MFLYELILIAAVSYTHLDVYKRQLITLTERRTYLDPEIAEGASIGL